MKNKKPKLSSVWALKYRPQYLKDISLSDELLSFFKNMIENKENMSLCFSGSAGTGKTTLAKILINEMDAEYMFLNGSGEDRGIDTIKTKVTQFATTRTLEGKPKIIVFDEGDNLTHDAQLALRSIIENVGSKCTFIITCNFPGKIVDPLLSRCHHIKIDTQDAKVVKKSFAKRMVGILKENDIEFDKEAIIGIINANYPDYRKMMNDFQQLSITHGEIRKEHVDKIKTTSFSGLVEVIKSKDYKALYQWIMNNVDDPSGFMLSVWSKVDNLFTNETFPYAIVFLNECQSEMAVVADKHLSLVACMSKITAECEILEQE